MNNFDPSLMNLTKLMPNQVGLMYVGGFFIFKIETSIQNIKIPIQNAKKLPCILKNVFKNLKN